MKDEIRNKTSTGIKANNNIGDHTDHNTASNTGNKTELASEVAKEALNKLLESSSFEISQPEIAKILEFYEQVLIENQIQNLTRLITPEDFYYGHVVDVLEMRRSGLLEYPALDLGSGVGVPGLLSALLDLDADEKSWILVESEKKKAEYLQRMVVHFKLASRVQVIPERIEDYLKKNQNSNSNQQQKPHSIVARAVGPVDRIYLWLRRCSTWNNLVLFKGPSWTEEWSRFQAGKFKKELQIGEAVTYEVGPEKKCRKLLKLIRVPRGTGGY